MRPSIASFLLVVLFMGLGACSPSDEDIATLVPTVSGSVGGGDSVSEESPRTDSAPSDRVPPTWTPMPTAEPPPPPPTRAPDETYVVQPGDTLAELATQFGVDLQQLASTNNIQNIDIIEVGQVLIIPR